MGLEFDWDLGTHPILAWRWRPQLFPRGGDERDPARNDSALGVYAIFPHSPVAVKTVKYVWSGTAPAGTTGSASRGLTRMLVLRADQTTGGNWVEESVNVAQDYRRLFGDAPKQPRGIALLTDADDTKSAGVGDYTDFRICPAAEPPTAQKRRPPAARPAAVKERTPPVDRPTRQPLPATPVAAPTVEVR
jgi:hypothetical protein